MEAKEEYIDNFPILPADGNEYNEMKEKLRLVKKCKFSDHFIHEMKLRYDIRKKKITSTRNPALQPSDKFINDRMADIAARVKEGNYPPANVISADETGVMFQASLKNEYVLPGQQPSETGKDKTRYTAMVWAAANGQTGPPFCIIQCNSINGLDLRSTTVVHKRWVELEEKEPGRWEELLWQSNLEFHNKKTNSVKTLFCARPYLKDKITGAIVTCQKKAWMDTVCKIFHFIISIS